MKNGLALCVFTGCLMSLPLQAGVEMKMSEQTPQGKGIGESYIYVQDKMIRVDGMPGSDDKTSMILKDDRLLILNHKDASYMTIDEASVSQIASKVDAAMEMMQQQLANLPPEQRAMMEKMMKEQMGVAMGAKDDKPAAPVRRVEKGASSSAGPYACTEYAIFEGSQKTQELCAASLADIEGAVDIKSGMEQLSSMFTRMLESFPNVPFMDANNNPMELMNEIDGFPVRTVMLKNGAPSRILLLKSTTTKTLPDTLFSAPEGYSQQSMMGR